MRSLSGGAGYYTQACVATAHHFRYAPAMFRHARKTVAMFPLADRLVAGHWVLYAQARAAATLWRDSALCHLGV